MIVGDEVRCPGSREAGPFLPLLTTLSARDHKSGWGCWSWELGILTIVTGRRLARRLVGEGRQRFSAGPLQGSGTVQKALRITRTAPSETASSARLRVHSRTRRSFEAFTVPRDRRDRTSRCSARLACAARRTEA